MDSKSCNNLSGIVLADRSFRDPIATLGIFAKTVETVFSGRFYNVKTKTISDELIASNFKTWCQLLASYAAHSSRKVHNPVSLNS